MNTNEVELVRDAVHCLTEYHQYSEEMRKIGKGFHPTGLKGHSIESVIMALTQLQKLPSNAATEMVVEVAREFEAGDIHPIARPIWNRLQAALKETVTVKSR
jgi:divalent metal cation (Fe/Co/Zn/Cd) transporter